MEGWGPLTSGRGTRSAILFCLPWQRTDFLSSVGLVPLPSGFDFCLSQALHYRHGVAANRVRSMLEREGQPTQWVPCGPAPGGGGRAPEETRAEEGEESGKGYRRGDREQRPGRWEKQSGGGAGGWVRETESLALAQGTV